MRTITPHLWFDKQAKDAAALNLGLDASLKAAFDTGLAGAEVIGCLVPR